MRKILVALTAACMVAAGAGTANAAPDATVRTQGDNDLVPNGAILSTLRFDPGAILVPHGGRVRWVHADETEEPHTVTVVNQAELPRTVDEAFNCAICNQTLNRHFGSEPPKTLINKGARGLDARGDSRLFFAGQSVTARVTAPSGSQLSYLCSIHPWMQGTIFVS